MVKGRLDDDEAAVIRPDLLLLLLLFPVVVAAAAAAAAVDNADNATVAVTARVGVCRIINATKKQTTRPRVEHPHCRRPCRTSGIVVVVLLLVASS